MVGSLLVYTSVRKMGAAFEIAHSPAVAGLMAEGGAELIQPLCLLYGLITDLG